MNRFLLGLLVIGVALGASDILISQKQEKNLGIKTQKVDLIDSLIFGPYNATVIIDNKDFISMGTKLQSSVEAIYVKKFDSIKKGQKLYALASSELLNLQSEYIEAIMEAEIVHENYQRNVKLKEKGIISQKKLLVSKKRKRSSDLKIKLIASHLLANGLNTRLIQKIRQSYMPITKLIVYSPREGLVHKIHVNIGEVVNPNKSVMNIYANGQRFVELSIPVTMIDSISVGDTCTFGSYEAKVSSIGNIVNQSSLSVEVRAKIQDAQNIMINRVYQAKISKKIQEGVKLTKSAIVFNENKYYVFKKTKTGFKAIQVEIIKEEARYYIIKADLDTSDVVAVSSTSALLSAMEE